MKQKSEKKSLRDLGALPNKKRQTKRISQIEALTLESVFSDTHKGDMEKALIKSCVELSVEDQKLFAQSIINPPKANGALTDAIRRYKKAKSRN